VRKPPPAGKRLAEDHSDLDLTPIYDAGPTAEVLTRRFATRTRLRRLVHQIDLDEAMRRRSVQQAILQAESWWWRMRAEQFHQARPRRGDFHGNATPAELWEAWERCNGIAQACLNKADLLDMEAGEA
jgi:hypothetical protein